MAKRSSRPDLADIMSAVPLRELAYGFTYQSHYKIKGDERTDDSPYPLHNGTPIYTRDHKVEGCRISPWMLEKFGSGQWTPSRETVNKITNAYHRWSHNKLREASVPIDQCRRLYKSDPQQVLHTIDVYSSHVNVVTEYIITEGEMNNAPISEADATIVAEWSVSMNEEPYEDFEDRYEETPA